MNAARRISDAGTPPPPTRADGARGRVSRLIHINAPRDVLSDEVTRKGKRHLGHEDNSNGARRELAALSRRSSCVRHGRRAARCARGKNPTIQRTTENSRETLARGSSAPSRRSRASPLPDARATDVRLREPRDGPEQNRRRRPLHKKTRPSSGDGRGLKLGDRLVARSVAFERSNYQSRGCGIDDGASRTFLRLVSDAHTAAE